eukprot:6103977-Pyramimonas_sp.AAC.1
MHRRACQRRRRGRRPFPDMTGSYQRFVWVCGYAETGLVHSYLGIPGAKLLVSRAGSGTHDGIA